MPERRTQATRRRDTGDKRESRSTEDEQAKEDRADDEPEEGTARGTKKSGISAADAASAGLSGLAKLTGKKPEGVTSVEPTDEGWRIGVEVLEDERVPSSADILAIYEADLDPDGTLLSYRRTRRYPRSRSDSDGER